MREQVQAQAMRQQQQPQQGPQTRPQPQQRVSQRPSVQNQERAKKPSQNETQGRGTSVLEFFHMTGGKAKKLTLSLTIGGVVLHLSEKEGDVLKSITFALSRTELISLSREIEFCVMGVRKPTPNNDSGRAPIVEFFHYNKNGQYKKLAVEAFEDGGIALVLRQGEKGLVPDGIVFALSRAEAIHLMEELKLLFELTRNYLPVE
jgi:hypothetical protein